MLVPTLANAAIVFDVSNVGNNQTFPSLVWELTDLNATNPAVTNPTTGSGTRIATGAFSGAGTFGGSESFTVTMTASTSWVKADAISNLADFGTYVANLAKQNVYIFDNHFNVGNSSMNGTTEALFLSVDTGNTSGPVSFTDMSFELTGGTDNADFLIWDSETQTLLANQNAKSTGLPLGTFSMTTGDILVIATTPTNTNDYRVSNFSFDIGEGAVAIPEPSAMLLLGLALPFVHMAGKRRKASAAVSAKGQGSGR